MRDTKIWFEDEKGKKFAIIKTEKIDMQKELTEQIFRLLEENKELKEELQIANDNLEVKQSSNDRQFDLLMKFNKAIKKLKKWYLPCGVEFETEEYEEFDDDGELIKVIEYYMIDKNTDEIYELNGLEEFRFMKEVFGE